MAKKGKKKKIRADFRKNRAARARTGDLTRQYNPDADETHDTLSEERLSGKGELVRKRTVVGEEVEGDDGVSIELDVDLDQCQTGRVLSVHGLLSQVQAEDGRIFRCATRRILKTLATDERHVVAAGDRVLFRPEGEDEGMIERVEPRSGVLSRTSRGRKQIIVSNVDQLVIVMSAAEPRLKPNLIDRYLISAEKAGIEPVICINKIDLVDTAELMPLVGVYAQLGYRVVLVSAETGFGVKRLRAMLADRESVLSGQSGVGKSSLLNQVDPQLALRVSHVSAESQKGRHTTTAAVLLPLGGGGYVVDTPGIRQFQLWDVIPEEVAGFFRDIRPYVNFCRYPDCSHTHEDDCAVKHAVADGRVDVRRYESYCYIRDGDEP